MKKILFVFVFVLGAFNTPFLLAQDLLKSQDLSTLKVDYLTDADIAKIKGQLQANNVTIEQAEPMALAKGMSAAEFAKLKTRLTANTPVTTTLKKEGTDKKSFFT